MPSVPERLQDAFLFRATQMLRLATSELRQVLRLLRDLETTLLSRLQRRDLDPTAPIRTAFQRARLTRLLNETQGEIATGYRAVAQQQRRSLIDVAQVEHVATTTMLNSAIGVDLLSPSLSPSQLRALVDDTFISGGTSQAATIKDWWGRQAAATQQRFAATIRQGMLQDETIGKLIQRVRGTRAARYQDGIMAISRRDAETLVRTAVMGVYNTAHDTTYREFPEVVQGRMLLVTLDSRTTPICIARSSGAWRNDGTPFPWSLRQEPFPGTPPYHMRCRSILVPVTRAYTDMVGRVSAHQKSAMQALEPEDKDALTLPRPRQEDYSVWLKRQPADIQVKVLGVKRRQLWLDGSLDLHDLIDQRGRPLTLKELQAS